MSITTTERDEARQQLRKIIRPGSEVLTVLRHVSNSGMTRRIDLYVINKGEMVYVSGYAAKACGWRRSDKGGIVVSGCGMDMGFHLVYELSRTLWPDGYKCIGKKCRSNDHSNGDRDYTPGHCVHRDGGYMLRHRWI